MRSLLNESLEQSSLLYQGIDGIRDRVMRSSHYAILLHRWEGKEILFDDLVKGQGVPRSLPGYAKFAGFCANAQKYGCNYGWIDTTCIDKSSSTELDESIRSMFTWYQNAEVCIVHLSGISRRGKMAEEEQWFTRGWTLQELLAPRKLKFYDNAWNEVFEDRYDIDCTPSSHLAGQPLMYPATASSALGQIAQISGIDKHTLLSYRPSAQKARTVFYWLSRRRTTRPEDMAYCLIGLLDVQLAIAYGEGLERAFFRLQVECAMQMRDRDLFMWTGSSSKWNSMFAKLPSAFSTKPESSVTATYLNSQVQIDTIPFDPTVNLTNHGLRIAVILYELNDLRDIRRVDDRISMLFYLSLPRGHCTGTLTLKWAIDPMLVGGMVHGWQLAVLGGKDHPLDKPCFFDGHPSVPSVGSYPAYILLQVEDPRVYRYSRIATAEFGDLDISYDSLGLNAKPPQIVYIE
ncbi:hypothetical protein HGRIS_006782 [Hohenbuehelia grisea]|uniref:Heterokaryon incompatibility domain-containing protein n=1 Tax=Hohenbuehelia grisea TaxID=104357 RepID=A0ABR3JAF4_9AGAR